MKYISVQPDITYFHWQVEVYIENFISIGINPKDINVIFMIGSSPSLKAVELRNKYTNVNFYFYEDDRVDKSYIPSIKPWGMFRHFGENKYLENERIFYHDSDIIFRDKIDETLFIDDKCYMSDTISYIGYNYCVSKGVEQLEKMVNIVGINVDIIKSSQESSGGAQYVMNSIQTKYWEKVYNDSNSLYKLMENIELNDKQNGTFSPGKAINYPIQKWCAEMWATLWNLWYFGYKTEVHKELNFSFATSPISEWHDRKIMHNAGVINSNNGLFYKGDYINKLPYNENLSIKEDTVSSKYWEWIVKTGEKSCLMQNIKINKEIYGGSSYSDIIKLRIINSKINFRS